MINSHITLLHPQVHADMYGAIAETFVVAIPLFEAGLSAVGRLSLTQYGTMAKPREMPLRVHSGLEWIGEDDARYVP